MQIFYLDRLDRQPLDWGCFPRIKAWSNEDVFRAVREDKHETDDFGKTGVRMFLSNLIPKVLNIVVVNNSRQFFSCRC